MAKCRRWNRTSSIGKGSEMTIEAYLREFERCLVGTPEEKRGWRAELTAHLDGASRAGELDAALKRLGSPRDAAAMFASRTRLVPASAARRTAAQAIDHAPLFAVALVMSLLDADRSSFTFGFPPPLMVSSEFGLLRNLVVPIVLLASWLGLALIESRRGRTPGKALCGLRTVSADSTSLTWSQALTRRFSIMLGLLAIIDWAAMFFTERQQRLLDLLAKTVVVSDSESRKPSLLGSR